MNRLSVMIVLCIPYTPHCLHYTMLETETQQNPYQCQCTQLVLMQLPMCELQTL
jgi:hypothetical protein